MTEPTFVTENLFTEDEIEILEKALRHYVYDEEKTQDWVIAVNKLRQRILDLEIKVEEHK